MSFTPRIISQTGGGSGLRDLAGLESAIAQPRSAFGGNGPPLLDSVLVIQTDLLTAAGHPSTVVLPLTTQVQDNAAPLRVRVPSGHPGFVVDSDVMIDQVRAIDNRRFYRGDSDALIKEIAPADAEILHNIERSLSLVLDLQR